MLAHIVPSKYKWFFKNYQKHQSAKPFIAVFAPNYFDENVDNVKFFEPKDVFTFNSHGNQIPRFCLSVAISFNKVVLI